MLMFESGCCTIHGCGRQPGKGHQAGTEKYHHCRGKSRDPKDCRCRLSFCWPSTQMIGSRLYSPDLSLLWISRRSMIGLVVDRLYLVRVFLRLGCSDGEDLDRNHSRMEERSLLIHGNQRIIHLVDLELVVCFVKC